MPKDLANSNRSQFMLDQGKFIKVLFGVFTGYIIYMKSIWTSINSMTYRCLSARRAYVRHGCLSARRAYVRHGPFSARRAYVKWPKIWIFYLMRNTYKSFWSTTYLNFIQFGWKLSELLANFTYALLAQMYIRPSCAKIYIRPSCTNITYALLALRFTYALLAQMLHTPFLHKNCQVSIITKSVIKNTTYSFHNTQGTDIAT